MTAFAYINWDVDPVLFEALGREIRWYGILFAAAFMCGYTWMTKVCKRERAPVEDLDKLLLFMVVGTVIGARLGHCLFYEPGYYLPRPLEIIKVWKGGLASHGAAIGLYLSLYLFSRTRWRYTYMWVIDRVCVGVAIGGCLIRLGNLFNHEIVGHPTDMPWGFRFTQFAAKGVSEAERLLPRHPSQLYESICYLIIFGVLVFVYLKTVPEVDQPRQSEEKKRRKKKGRLKTKTEPEKPTLLTSSGLIHGIYLIGIFGARFAVEFTKVRQAEFGESLPLSMGQILSIPLILVGVGFVLWSQYPEQMKRLIPSRRNVGED